MIELILEKLGEAIYTHKQLEKIAREAEEAVDYFESVGLFEEEE